MLDRAPALLTADVTAGAARERRRRRTHCLFVGVERTTSAPAAPRQSKAEQGGAKQSKAERGRAAVGSTPHKAHPCPRLSRLAPRWRKLLEAVAGAPSDGALNGKREEETPRVSLLSAVPGR